MPEGDSILRAARALHAALAGRAVTAFSSTVPEVSLAARQLRVVGRSVDAVEARGKHLLVRFSGGVVLHSHLGMVGSWHLYRITSRWRLPRHLARAVVEAGDRVAVCFQAPTMELLQPEEEASHPSLTRLGPDVLASGFDLDLACTRLRADGAREIAVALLDQQALAGIGNIYKSESLFVCRIHPRRPVGGLSDGELQALVRTASALMRRNLAPGPRRTVLLAAATYWVYSRQGRPCRRCGERIARILQGRPSRSTYYCPRCQAAEVTPAGASRPSSSLPRRRP